MSTNTIASTAFCECVTMDMRNYTTLHKPKSEITEKQQQQVKQFIIWIFKCFLNYIFYNTKIACTIQVASRGRCRMRNSHSGLARDKTMPSQSMRRFPMKAHCVEQHIYEWMRRLSLCCHPWNRINCEMCGNLEMALRSQNTHIISERNEWTVWMRMKNTREIGCISCFKVFGKTHTNRHVPSQ